MFLFELMATQIYNNVAAIIYFLLFSYVFFLLPGFLFFKIFVKKIEFVHYKLYFSRQVYYWYTGASLFAFFQNIGAILNLTISESIQFYLFVVIFFVFYQIVFFNTKKIDWKISIKRRIARFFTFIIPAFCLIICFFIFFPYLYFSIVDKPNDYLVTIIELGRTLQYKNFYYSGYLSDYILTKKVFFPIYIPSILASAYNYFLPYETSYTFLALFLSGIISLTFLSFIAFVEIDVLDLSQRASAWFLFFILMAFSLYPYLLIKHKIFEILIVSSLFITSLSYIKFIFASKNVRKYELFHLILIFNLILNMMPESIFYFLFYILILLLSFNFLNFNRIFDILTAFLIAIIIWIPNIFILIFQNGSVSELLSKFNLFIKGIEFKELPSHLVSNQYIYFLENFFNSSVENFFLFIFFTLILLRLIQIIWNYSRQYQYESFKIWRKADSSYLWFFVFSNICFVMIILINQFKDISQITQNWFVSSLDLIWPQLFYSALMSFFLLYLMWRFNRSNIKMLYEFSFRLSHVLKFLNKKIIFNSFLFGFILLYYSGIFYFLSQSVYKNIKEFYSHQLIQNVWNDSFSQSKQTVFQYAKKTQLKCDITNKDLSDIEFRFIRSQITCIQPFQDIFLNENQTIIRIHYSPQLKIIKII